MRVDLSQYLPEPVTAVFRVDAKDAGGDRDELRAVVIPDAMWHVSSRRAVGADGYVETVRTVTVQVPAPGGFMPYRRYVAAGCPDGCWTLREGDRLIRGEAEGDPGDLMCLEGGAVTVASVRGLDRAAGFRFRGRRGGAMRYARAIVAEGA